MFKGVILHVSFYCSERTKDVPFFAGAKVKRALNYALRRKKHQKMERLIQKSAAKGSRANKKHAAKTCFEPYSASFLGGQMPLFE